MQLYATIRKKSGYYHQNKFDTKGLPVPFEVTIDFDGDPSWPVQGGIGGNYKIFDVDLYYCRQEGDKLKKLSVHEINHD